MHGSAALVRRCRKAAWHNALVVATLCRYSTHVQQQEVCFSAACTGWHKTHLSCVAMQFVRTAPRVPAVSSPPTDAGGSGLNTIEIVIVALFSVVGVLAAVAAVLTLRKLRRRRQANSSLDSQEAERKSVNTLDATTNPSLGTASVHKTSVDVMVTGAISSQAHSERGAPQTTSQRRGARSSQAYSERGGAQAASEATGTHSSQAQSELSASALQVANDTVCERTTASAADLQTARPHTSTQASSVAQPSEPARADVAAFSAGTAGAWPALPTDSRIVATTRERQGTEQGLTGVDSEPSFEPEPVQFVPQGESLVQAIQVRRREGGDCIRMSVLAERADVLEFSTCVHGTATGNHLFCDG